MARVHKSRDLLARLVCGNRSQWQYLVFWIEGKPVFGYLAAVLLVVASALAIPAFTDALLSGSSRWLGEILGVEALLASQSLSASLRRSSVLVGALSTASCDDDSVGIMVGSFRNRSDLMNDRLLADLYLSARRQSRARPPSDRLSRIGGQNRQAAGRRGSRPAARL